MVMDTCCTDPVKDKKIMKNGGQFFYHSEGSNSLE